MKYTETRPMRFNDFAHTTDILTDMKCLALAVIVCLLLVMVGAPIIGIAIPLTKVTYMLAVMTGCAIALIPLEAYAAAVHMQWHEQWATVTDLRFDEDTSGQRIAHVIFDGESGETIIPYKSSYEERFNTLRTDQRVLVTRRTSGFATRQSEGRLG